MSSCDERRRRDDFQQKSIIWSMRSRAKTVRAQREQDATTASTLTR